EGFHRLTGTLRTAQQEPVDHLCGKIARFPLGTVFFQQAFGPPLSLGNLPEPFQRGPLDRAGRQHLLVTGDHAPAGRRPRRTACGEQEERAATEGGPPLRLGKTAPVPGTLFRAALPGSTAAVEGVGTETKNHDNRGYAIRRCEQAKRVDTRKW